MDSGDGRGEVKKKIRFVDSLRKKKIKAKQIITYNYIFQDKLYKKIMKKTLTNES